MCQAVCHWQALWLVWLCFGCLLYALPMAHGCGLYSIVFWLFALPAGGTGGLLHGPGNILA